MLEAGRYSVREQIPQTEIVAMPEKSTRKAGGCQMLVHYSGLPLICAQRRG